jgi:hypothetical protein
LNRKIVLYDKEGSILWGKEPKIFKSSSDDLSKKWINYLEKYHGIKILLSFE